ncbi:MAG: hypothetical protein ACRD1P_10145, partial [Thermoanaerobaculia bacterium]
AVIRGIFVFRDGGCRARPPAMEDTVNNHRSIEIPESIMARLHHHVPGLHLFDGFPYLVTRVVGALRHFIVLPGDRAEGELCRLAERQVEANRLETVLVLGTERAVYYSVDGTASPGTIPPRGNLPVCDKLQPAEDFPQTPELVNRIEGLHAFIEALDPKGFLVGDSTIGNRPATAEEMMRLAGRDARGIPRGLVQCLRCREYRGACLDEGPEQTGQVRTVHCPCENHNRCARCGDPLSDRRLNANFFDRLDGCIWHTPAFCGLDHRCPAQGEHAR